MAARAPTSIVLPPLVCWASPVADGRCSLDLSSLSKIVQPLNS